MRCYICNSNQEVGKCIVCGKWVCYEKHAEVFWLTLDVNSDCGTLIKSDNLRLEYYCCLKGHSREEIRKGLKKEFRKIPNYLKYIEQNK